MSDVTPVSAPTSENVIQLLRARGLIQVQTPSAIVEQSKFLMASWGFAVSRALHPLLLAAMLALMWCLQ